MQKNLQNQNELAQYLPKPYKKRRYYTPVDVSVHNTPNDCWISLFNEIFDLTELIQKNIHCKIENFHNYIVKNNYLSPFV